MSHPNRYHLPRDRRYHPRDHLWVKPEGTGEPGTVVIGMDELQLGTLGEFAYVDLKLPGTIVEAGESFGTLEAAKMTAEIFVPLSGAIVRVNEAALARPLLVNESPYTGGWLMALAPSRWQVEWPGLIGAATPLMAGTRRRNSVLKSSSTAPMTGIPRLLTEDGVSHRRGLAVDEVLALRTGDGRSPPLSGSTLTALTQPCWV